MIKIKYVEYNATHPSDFEFDIPEGHDCWLIILTHTPAIFFIDGVYKEYPPNCAVLYEPHQKIYYRACVDSFINDWVRFDIDEPYISAKRLPCGVPFVVDDPSYCHKIFQLLTTEHILNNDFKDMSIEALMNILINKLFESCNYEHVSSLNKNLIKLKMDIYLNPYKTWTVTKMASELYISVGYLEDMYKKTFGISCMDDVIKSRINMAQKHLLYTNYPITEIANLCGYRNIEHFYRQFKKVTGFTPKHYRNISR